VIFVLHFSLGQGGAVVDAPVDRLQAAIDEALFQEAVKRLQSLGLVRARHGFVGRLPAPEAANALKLLRLQVDILLRVGPAGVKHLRYRHSELFMAQFLVDLDLDGQPVAVIAGDVGGVEPGHGLRFDHEVLQALVESVAQVNGSVGVGRAVVEQVNRPALAGFAQLLIEAE